MLLRSASTPILNSWTPHSKEPSSEPELLHQIQRTRSITLTVSCSSSLSILASDDSTRKMTKALSDTDLRNIAMPKRKAMDNSIFSRFCVEEEREEADFEWWTTDSHLVVEEEGCGVGGGGGKFCGRRGWGGSDGGDDGGRSESWDSNHRNNSTDVYYQKMIEANPGNALLLSNYARFLKEVRGDLAKAEEYCGRAISANPNDGAVLSMYADMIWQSHRDASRAASYFDQAVKAAPDDCYVLASYARFLWDAEDEVEEGEEEMSKSSQLRLSYLNAAPPPPPVTAAS